MGEALFIVWCVLNKTFDDTLSTLVFVSLFLLVLSCMTVLMVLFGWLVVCLAFSQWTISVLMVNSNTPCMSRS